MSTHLYCTACGETRHRDCFSAVEKKNDWKRRCLWCCRNRYYQPLPHQDRDRIIDEQDRRRRGEKVYNPLVDHSSISDTEYTDETPASSDDDLLDNRDSDEITVEASSSSSSSSDEEVIQSKSRPKLRIEDDSESSSSSQEEAVIQRKPPRKLYIDDVETGDSSDENEDHTRLRKKQKLGSLAVDAKCRTCGNLKGRLFKETGTARVFCNIVCQLTFHTNAIQMTNK